MIKVVIVDDDFIIRQAMSEMIDWAALDCVVVALAADGGEALAQIARHQPDLVFTDVVMPGIGGIELLERMYSQWPWIKVVMISAHDEAEYIRQSIRCDAVDYLIKPFGDGDLRQAVDRVRDKLRKERIVLSQKMGASTEGLLDLAGHRKAIVDRFAAADLSALEMKIRALFYTLRAQQVQSILLINSICVELLISCMQVLRERVPEGIDEEMSGRLNQLTRLQSIADIEELMVESLRQMCLSLHRDESATKKLVNRAIQVIEGNYWANLTIAQLARQLHVSENYLQALFKREQGQTIRSYITLVRMERAKQLLRQTDEKVSTVGVMVGYHDADYFTVTFRKVVGETPSSYRERNV